jgi:hypothetical protein
MGEIVFPGVKAKGSVQILAFGSLVNGDLITIGNAIYEFRTSGSPAAGHVAVAVGASNALTAAALAAAIVAFPPTVATLSAPVTAYVDSVDTATVRIEGVSAGSAGNMTFVSTMTGGTNTIDAVGGLMVGGENASLKHEASGRYTVTALDVLANSFMIPTPLASPKILSIQCFTAAGKNKAITTAFTPSGTRIKGAPDAGTDPIATDVIAWMARD